MMKIIGKIADDGLSGISQVHRIAGQHKIPRIWVAVIDAHRFRLFQKPDGHLEQMGEGIPTGLHRRHGIPNKSLGRIVSSAGRFICHRLQPRHSDNDKDHIKFAVEVAEWLNRAAQEDSYDRLILVAAPKMLGIIRKYLSDAVEARITAEIHKDLTRMNESELLKELNKILWF